MHNQPAIAIKKWTIQADCITTGIRYPASINTTNLTDHQVTELISKIVSVGNPSSEQWVELRAWAANERIASTVELADSLDAAWDGNPTGHSQIEILALIVGDVLNRDGLHDAGSHEDRTADMVATMVLGEKVLVSFGARTAEVAPEAVGNALAARIAGSIRRKGFEPKPEVVDQDTATSEDWIDQLADQMELETMAEYLETRGDINSLRVAHFFRTPRLWGMSSEEVADTLGVEAASWRKSQSRAFRILRERFAAV